MNSQPITPGSTLLWAFVSVLIALMAMMIGDMVSLSGERTHVILAKGLIAMIISGLVGATITGWFLHAIFKAVKAFRGR